MSPPIKNNKNSLHGAIHEIISAMSALNMESELLEPSTGGYLSETNKWAAHAMEHLNTAILFARSRKDLC